MWMFWKYIMALPHKNDPRCLCGFFCFFQVPVPMFLPTTLQNAEQIVKTISELKAKVSSDPLEADLIAMAEVIAQEEEKPKCSVRTCLESSPFDRTRLVFVTSLLLVLISQLCDTL